MSGVIEVAGFSLAFAVLIGSSTWRLEGEPVSWSRRASVGGAYRAANVESSPFAPRSVERARIFARLVVAASIANGLFLLALTLSREYARPGGYGDGISLERTYIPPEHYFDSVGAMLYGFLLIVTGGVIGAFGRWARDAASDRTQAIRPMPLYAAGAIAVATVLVEIALRFNHPPGFEHRPEAYDWPIASVYIVTVLLGAFFVDLGRRAALKIT